MSYNSFIPNLIKYLRSRYVLFRPFSRNFIADGCIYQGSSYALGTFNIGCDFSCQCNSDGQVSCNTRCRPPFHPIGTTAGDPLCVEQSVAGDGCCVTIICSNHAPGSDGTDEHGPCKEIKVSIGIYTCRLYIYIYKKFILCTL